MKFFYGVIKAMNVYVIFVALFLVILSCLATIRIARDSILTKRQRFVQIVLVWVIPVLGPILVTAIHRSQKKHQLQKDSEPWTAISDQQAIDMAIAQRITEVSHHGAEASHQDSDY